MSHAPAPRSRGLVSALLRLASAPFSIALGGLLLAAPASAQDATTRAAITDLAVEEGALTARILWPDTAELPDSAMVVSYTGQGEPSARIPVSPKPNTTLVVRLPGALDKPWESGWAQKLTVEDSAGQVIASQPYDVNLDCDGNGDKERCQLAVSASVSTNSGVLHLSEDLDAALTELTPRAGEEFDLVGRVSQAYPELRGEAIVYGDQVARLRRPGPCECNWGAVIARNPSSTSSKYRTAYLSVLYGDNGAGAKHWLQAKAHAQLFSSVHEISDSVGGESKVTLKLNCSQLLYIISKPVIIFHPDGTSQIIHVYHPVYGSCTAPCRATFNHLGRYTGETYVRAEQRPSNRAFANEVGSYWLDSTQLLNQSLSGTNSFDNTSGGTVTGYSTTGRINTYGYTRAVGRAKSAEAWVRNGYALAIRGYAACGVYPQEAAAYDFGTTRGWWHENDLKNHIRNFFWQWYIPVNP